MENDSVLTQAEKLCKDWHQINEQIVNQNDQHIKNRLLYEVRSLEKAIFNLLKVYRYQKRMQLF